MRHLIKVLEEISNRPESIERTRSFLISFFQKQVDAASEMIHGYEECDEEECLDLFCRKCGGLSNLQTSVLGLEDLVWALKFLNDEDLLRISDFVENHSDEYKTPYEWYRNSVGKAGHPIRDILLAFKIDYPDAPNRFIY